MLSAILPAFLAGSKCKWFLAAAAWTVWVNQWGASVKETRGSSLGCGLEVRMHKNIRNKGHCKSLRIQSIHEKPLHESVKEMWEVTGHVPSLASCPYFVTPWADNLEATWGFLSLANSATVFSQACTKESPLPSPQSQSTGISQWSVCMGFSSPSLLPHILLHTELPLPVHRETEARKMVFFIQ